MQETGVLGVFVASVSTGETCLQESWAHEVSEKCGAMKTYPWCEGGSNKGTFKQTKHARIRGTWWDAPTTVEGAACHCKATLDCHLWKVIVIRGGS